MARQITEEQMHEAYVRANLGAEASYAVWTPLWALRSKIWRDKDERKVARRALGETMMDAIDLADVDELEDLAAALKDMLVAERAPAYAVLADVYFALEQLNAIAPAFTKADLLKWLNKEMDAVMTAPEVEGALREMGLTDVVPVAS